MRILITGGSGFIGTNMVEHFSAKGNEVLNIDCAAPQNPNHNKYWACVDILDAENLQSAISEFAPEYVIHLAARTDLDGKSLQEYDANITGVKNMVEALRNVLSVKRVIFASTQLVCARRNPENDNDYETVNLYGESKKIGEEFLHNSKDLPFEYTIVRPTSIWGPWFRTPYNQFFKLVMKKRYFSMGSRAATKTFGYIGNLLYQVETLLLKPDWNNIREKVFYLGDAPATSINDWAAEIAGECGFRIVTIPYFVFKLAAFFGDFLKLFGIRFPMTSYRLANMTSSFTNDLSLIYTEAPEPPYSRLEGTKITLEWLKNNQ